MGPTFEMPHSQFFPKRENPWNATFSKNKPKTDTFNYLHWGSYHPHHTKQSTPYSLAIRLIRICSTEEALTSRLKQLTTHLKRRGYPNKKIEAATNRARNTPRPQALQRRRNKDTQAERIPLVHTYNPAIPNISSIFLKYLPVLHLLTDVEKPSQNHICQPFADPLT